MSVKALDFCGSFFQVKYVENENKFFAGQETLFFNLSKNRESYILDSPVPPLKGRIVNRVEITNIEAAIFVEGYAGEKNNKILFEAIRNTWPTLFSITGLERHKGLPYHRSPRKVQLNEETTIYFCYAAPGIPSGPHKDHARNYDEVHGQILGYGKMQKLMEKDQESVYEEVILAPGIVHDKFCNEKGIYPWHQYFSITDCIYMPIEIDR